MKNTENTPNTQKNSELNRVKALVEILTKETRSLKKQYVLLTKVWALKNHKRAVDMVSWTEARWCEYLGIEAETKTSHYRPAYKGFPKGFFNTRASKEYFNTHDATDRITRLAEEEYMLKEEKKAEEHYEYSIQKLALRVDKKGLDLSKLTVATSHIGVNIDTVLTDGEKTVKAFTIVASGPIQRPHYRYLIK